MTPIPRFLQAPDAAPKELPEEKDGTLIGWIHRGLRRFSSNTIERLAVVATLGLGVLHYALPGELSFTLFYLAPITAAAWYADRSGHFVSVLAAAIWTVATFAGLPDAYPLGVLIWSAGVHLGTFLAVSVLTVRLSQSVDIQQRARFMEPLTGLANSRAFRGQLAEENDRALRYGRIFTVAYLDLDDFKEVNDSLGHAEGDEVLRRVAGVLREGIRSTDMVARMGGDEFALLFPETPYAQAEGALQKIRKRVNEAMEEGGWATSLSIGAATFEAPVNSADEALRLSDRLMYEAKAEGGDSIRHILWTGEDAHH